MISGGRGNDERVSESSVCHTYVLDKIDEDLMNESGQYRVTGDVASGVRETEREKEESAYVHW